MLLSKTSNRFHQKKKQKKKRDRLFRIGSLPMVHNYAKPFKRRTRKLITEIQHNSGNSLVDLYLYLHLCYRFVYYPYMKTNLCYEFAAALFPVT